MRQLWFAGWETIPRPVRRSAAEVSGIEDLAGDLRRRVRERWTAGCWALLEGYGFLEERNVPEGR